MDCPFAATFTPDNCVECNYWECEHNMNPDNPGILQLEPEYAVLFMGGECHGDKPNTGPAQPRVP